jgi:phosphohistidine phosphatase SixA
MTVEGGAPTPPAAPPPVPPASLKSLGALVLAGFAIWSCDRWMDNNRRADESRRAAADIRADREEAARQQAEAAFCSGPAGQAYASELRRVHETHGATRVEVTCANQTISARGVYPEDRTGTTAPSYVRAALQVSVRALVEAGHNPKVDSTSLALHWTYEATTPTGAAAFRMGPGAMYSPHTDSIDSL